MSTYGQSRSDQPEYEAPYDPWGDPNRPAGDRRTGAYGGGGYTDPAYGASEYGGTEYRGMEYPGDPGTAPSGRSSTRLLVTIVGVLAVLLVGGVATAYFVTGRDDKSTPAQGAQTGGPSGAAAGAEPTAVAGRTGTPAPQSSAEARFAALGQCLVNDGTDAKPSMRIVACGPGTYQVLARFDGTTDYAGKCATVKGYKYHYYFDAELDSLDFVLCLKKR